MCCGSTNHSKTKPTAHQELSPIDLLKIRLAKGEISFEEYEKTKALLEK